MFPLSFKVNNQNAGRIENGTYNTSLGYEAFLSNTTGQGNTATGFNVLKSNTTGSYNTSSGD